MVLHLVFPNTVGQAFGPDFRLINGFVLAADPFGHLLVWVRAFVAILVAGTGFGWLISKLAARVRAVPALDASAREHSDCAVAKIVVGSRRG